MDEKGKVETLDGFIENEQGSLKWSAITATGLFVIGLATSGVVLWMTFSAEGLTKFISFIPGAIGTAVSAFPVKEYYAKKNRITSCKLFRIAYTSPPVSEEIDKRFWTLIDKSLG